MNTFVVTAGTNIGADPMGPSALELYRSELDWSIGEAATTVFTRPDGATPSNVGSWVDDGGRTIVERALVWAGTADESGIAAIRFYLGEIASQFSQDRIGFVVVPHTDTVVRSHGRVAQG